MELGKNVIKGLKIGTMLRLIAQIFTWVNTLILIRLLTPNDYGIMAMAMAFVGVLALMGDLGIHKALIQAQELTVQQYRQAFAINIISCCSFFTIFYFSAPLIAYFFHDPIIITPIRVIAIQHLIMIFHTLPYAQASRLMLFKKREQVQFYATIITSVVTIILAFMGFGVWALIFGHLLLKLALTIGYNIISPCWIKPSLNFYGASKLVGFGGIATLNDMLRYLFNVFPNIWIGRVFNKLELGVFSVARNLSNLPGDKIGELLNHLGLASFAKLQHEPQVAGSYLLKSINLASIVLFPMYFGMCAVATDAISCILSDKWLVAVLPFQILCLASPFRMLAELLAVATTALGKPKKNSCCILYSLALLPLILVASNYNLRVVCWSWLVITVISFIIHLIVILPSFHVRIKDFMVAIFPSFFSAGIMLMLLLIIRPNIIHLIHPVMLFILLIMIGVILFTTCIYVLFRKQLNIVLSYLRH